MKKVTERANDLTYTGAMGFKGEMNKAGSYTHYVFGRYSNKPKGRFFWFLISKGWQKNRPKINQKNRPFGLRVKPRNRRLSGRIFCCGNDDKRLLG